MPHLRDSHVVILEEGVTSRDLIDQMVGDLPDTDEKDAFYVADLGDVVKKHLRFVKALPRVTPFYAVSCNSSPGVLQTLADLGTGFHCWSKTELELVEGFGVPPERIIYANPCKQPSHMQHAARTEVTVMTFDSKAELVNVSTNHPNARMVLRIHADNSTSTFPSSEKFGAPLESCRHLLEVAKSLNLEVIGVSFHVGTGCRDPRIFTRCIADARLVFDMAEASGQKMHLLDIGGGFPGTEDSRVRFQEFVPVITSALETHFPEGCGVEVIAEPGRYYVESAFLLVANIIGKKNGFPATGFACKDSEKCSSRSVKYHLNEGVFGSFNNVLFENIQLRPVPQKKPSPGQPVHVSSLWGPTCDCVDKISDGVELPEQKVGDWIIFDNMGAYTFTISSPFNGFLPSKIHYSIPHETWKVLELFRKGLQQNPTFSFQLIIDEKK
ncbi:antizyme inhibitor 2-like [Ambystoma mexicanum]|uniref:antizyme inhibitor 2-like n=1 Tax=Ambystoma mexicanum TaxID=8296 RepID=UPI0037E8D7FE